MPQRTIWYLSVLHRASACIIMSQHTSACLSVYQRVSGRLWWQKKDGTYKQICRSHFMWSQISRRQMSFTFSREAGFHGDSLSFTFRVEPLFGTTCRSHSKWSRISGATSRSHFWWSHILGRHVVHILSEATFPSDGFKLSKCWSRPNVASNSENEYVITLYT